MYTQLFGQYLLNNKIVSSDDLHKAFARMSQTRVKLGALAIDAVGFIATASER